MLPHSYRMSWSRGVHHQVYTHTRNNHVGRGGSDQRQPKDEQCGGSGEVCVSLVGGGGGGCTYLVIFVMVEKMTNTF